MFLPCLAVLSNHINVILSVQFQHISISCQFYQYQILCEIENTHKSHSFYSDALLTYISLEVNPYLLNTAYKYVFNDLFSDI